LLIRSAIFCTFGVWKCDNACHLVLISFLVSPIVFSSLTCLSISRFSRDSLGLLENDAVPELRNESTDAIESAIVAADFDTNVEIATIDAEQRLPAIDDT
jgi:hypothetical protein